MNAKLSVLVVLVTILVSGFLFIPDASGQDLETVDLSKLGAIAGTKTITMAVSIMNIDGYTKTNVFTSLVENSEEKINVKNSTATSCDQVELKKPIILDPPSGQLETISPEFKWDTIDDMNQDEMRFYIEVYEPDAAYFSALVMIPVYINPRTNWIWFSNFKANQEYEWYAYYYCPLNDETGPLEYGTFTTGDGHNLPDAPILTSPEDNSFISSEGDFTGVTFDWEGNQSINYFVEYVPSEFFPYWFPISWVDSTSFSGIGLQNGSYNWRVKARNEYGIGDASEDRRFVIGNEEDCISPTGLNICLLQKGDILLGRYKGSPNEWLFQLGSTYWYHTAIVVEDTDKFQVAEASRPDLAPADQVRTLPITDTLWWNDVLIDWSVVRLKSNVIGTSDIINEATLYAKEKAEQISPYILYNTDFFDYEDVEDKFYCSQLVWKAYKKYSVDLRSWIAFVVTPDDLYYSRKSEEVQGLSNNKRFIFSLHSPADLLIIDNHGRRVGFDSDTQQVFNEIPGAYYTGSGAEPEYISVGVPNTTTLRLNVTGTGVGTYTLNAQWINSEVPISQTIIQPITLGQVDEFLVVDSTEVTTTTEILAEIKSKLYLPLIMKIYYP